MDRIQCILSCRCIHNQSHSHKQTYTLLLPSVYDRVVRSIVIIQCLWYLQLCEQSTAHEYGVLHNENLN